MGVTFLKPVIDVYATKYQVVSIENLQLNPDASAYVISVLPVPVLVDINTSDGTMIAPSLLTFAQAPGLTDSGIGVEPYGSFIINTVAPSYGGAGNVPITIESPDGTVYSGTTNLNNILTEGVGYVFNLDSSN